ncbi:helix-loop-helix protein delilah-like [Gigantopelta aegis]|uniref:helix-loop-helix protein delilah-like n=1 Tax=Gigantopelta aegis TaxID=1735272 RepID=UPI001B8881B8|nr:helix-loop-helix protein delilah-like [Gigantopelta aegis]
MDGSGDTVMETTLFPIPDMESEIPNVNSNSSKTDSEKQNTDSTSESESAKTTKVEKYNLRRITVVNRIETEKKLALPRQPKAKAKPPPLSKYRRRAANARERNRMQEINVAFEALRNAVPNIDSEMTECALQKNATSNMTKITTLRLAMNYIRALRQILGQEDDLGSDASSTRSTSISSGDESCLSPSDGDFNHSDSASEGILSLEADDISLFPQIIS